MSLAAPVLPSADVTRARLGIVAARFNGPLVDGLLDRVVGALRGAGVPDRNIRIVRVPGSHEVPWAAQALARRGRCDCVVGLGVLLAGATSHHDLVGRSVAQALQQVALGTGVPVINGVLVVESLAQARARCIGRINRGAEFAAAALAMAGLKRKLQP